MRGFEQGTGGGSAAGILGQGLVGFRSVLRRQKKSQSKSDAGGAHKAAVDDEDEAGEVDESTQLLVADGDRAGTTPNRRVSSTTVANGQQQCGAASTTGSDSTAAIGGGSGGCGASAGRPSRVLRLMDGSTPGFSVEDLSAWVPGRHHMPTCVCTELSFSIAPGEVMVAQYTVAWQVFLALLSLTQTHTHGTRYVCVCVLCFQQSVFARLLAQLGGRVASSASQLKPGCATSIAWHAPYSDS